MPIGSFNGLNLSLSGLLAHQRALDVTSHNVANAETPGYSRQEAVLGTRDALDISAGAVLNGLGAQLGQGVDVQAYRRLRDDFLDAQWRGQNMSLGANDASAGRLGQVEDALKEPADAGLGNLLDTFFSAWQDLANNPESSAAKAAVVGHAQNLAQAFNTVDRDMGQVAADATAEVDQLLSPQGPIQAIAAQLASLNDSIRHATQAGVAPNDQLDRRDQLLDQLSRYGQVSVTPDATAGNDGMIIVSFGGAATPLVTGTTATVPTAAQLSTPGGRLGALQTVAGTTIPTYRAALDAVAGAITGAVNAAHATAVFSGTTAATLAVVATPGSIVAGPSGAGDTTAARAVAALRTGANASLGGISITQAYANLLQRIGGDAAAATTAAKASDAVVDALTERRHSVAGVSMDEEMANMVRFQRGYQAAARALTTMDEALDTLINRTGRVGL